MGSWACSHPLLLDGLKPIFKALLLGAQRTRKAGGKGYAAPHSQACPQAPCQALEQGMEAPPPASTCTSNLGSTVRLFVTECTVAHSLQRDMVSLPPRGPTSVGAGGEALGWGQPQKCAVTRQDPPQSKGGAGLGMARRAASVPIPRGLSLRQGTPERCRATVRMLRG